VRSGKTFQEWIETLRKGNHKTLFFTTEPSRMNALKRELKEFRKFEVITTPRHNMRFAIARVEL
jgi:hypothetical protein